MSEASQKSTRAACAVLLICLAQDLPLRPPPTTSLVISVGRLSLNSRYPTVKIPGPAVCAQAGHF